MSNLEIPTISVSNAYSAEHSAWVMEDVSQGVGDLVRHLVDELGHRRIALIMGPHKNSSSQPVRSSGLLIDELLRQLRQRGIEVPAGRVIHADLLDTSPVTTAAHQWLTHCDRPTAIIAATDRYAIEVLNVAAALGVEVSREVSVASWYDEMENSPLTSIRVPLEQMGQEAMVLLSSALAGGLVIPRVIPVRLIKRRTTGMALKE